MTWEIDSFTEIGGNKSSSFPKIIGLARKCLDDNIHFRLAVNGPHELLREHHWNPVSAVEISSTPEKYRTFIEQSRGEFGVAKATYVESCSGWFSDRSACYLAMGKPVIIQATGFQAHLPTGKGLLCWNDEEEAFDCLQLAESDYAGHALAARAVAEEYLDSQAIVAQFLSKC